MYHLPERKTSQHNIADENELPHLSQNIMNIVHCKSDMFTFASHPSIPCMLLWPSYEVFLRLPCNHPESYNIHKNNKKLEEEKADLHDGHISIPKICKNDKLACLNTSYRLLKQQYN